MTVRIDVTYAAADGAMPESIEIEWTADAITAGHDALLLLVLDRMLNAPMERRTYDELLRDVAYIAPDDADPLKRRQG